MASYLLKEWLNHRERAFHWRDKNTGCKTTKRQVSPVLRALFVSRQNLGGFQALTYLEAEKLLAGQLP